MPEDPQPEPNSQVPLFVGVAYLTFCSAMGGAVPLWWYPRSVYVQAAFVVALVAGLAAALVARLPDPCARPVRFGLLWLALGFLVGPGIVLGGLYLVLEFLRWLTPPFGST